MRYYLQCTDSKSVDVEYLADRTKCMSECTTFKDRAMSFDSCNHASKFYYSMVSLMKLKGRYKVVFG